MKNVPLITGTVYFLLITSVAFSQWTRVIYPFSEVPVISEYQDGAGFSFFDVNEDGWDDLTFCTNGGPTRYYQNNQGTFELTYSFPNMGIATSCVWADIDEDGDNDLIVSRYDLPIQIFKNNGNNEFQVSDYMVGYGFNQNNRLKGLSLADYNRDAYLDIAAANYTQSNSNLIFTNNNGEYFQQLEYSDLNAHTKKSFQPAWCDVNNDLFPDLFFGNDNGVGNEFYVQNENGYFTDQSMASNLVAPAFAMCASFADFDNDADQDLFISDGQLNQYPLMINDGQGVFTQDFVQPLFFNLEGWGSLWIDADNDGWQDLFICTRGGGIDNQDFNNVFLKNSNGNLTSMFIPQITDVGLGYYCNAKGDFNNDGKEDMVLTVEDTGQILFLENTSENNNHYIKFKLNGRLSNRNGIGAKYECHFNNQVRTGHLQAGENFLTQNSQNIIIGIGESDIVDSLIIGWPSGVVDKYYNIDRGTFTQLTEAETLPGIVFDSNCNNTTLAVGVFGWANQLWSNGSQNANTTYNQGPIEVEVSTGYGHPLLLTAEAPVTASYSIQSIITPPNCPEMTNGQIYFWVTNDQGIITQEWTADNIGEGFISVSFPYGTGCTHNEMVEITALSHPHITSVLTQNTCPFLNDGTVTVTMTGGVLPYNQNFSDTIVIDSLGAGFFQGTITDFYDCPVSYQAEISINNYDYLIQHPTCQDESNGQVMMLYNNNQGQIETYVFDSLSTGYQNLTILSENGCPLSWSGTLGYQDSIQITLNIEDVICEGDSILFDPAMITNTTGGNWYFSEPGEWLTAGEQHAMFESPSGCLWDTTFYIVATSAPEIAADINLPSNGNEGSVLINAAGAFGPYTILWTDNNSTDWQLPITSGGTYSFIITDGYQCSFSDSTTVIITNTSEIKAPCQWRVEGNRLFYNGSATGLPIRIYNEMGQLIFQKSIVDNMIELPTWSAGVYYLQDGQQTFRWMIHP
jgi:FG-GAP-like repeat/ASPIC and UnbV